MLTPYPSPASPPPQIQKVCVGGSQGLRQGASPSGFIMVTAAVRTAAFPRIPEEKPAIRTALHLQPPRPLPGGDLGFHWALLLISVLSTSHQRPFGAQALSTGLHQAVGTQYPRGCHRRCCAELGSLLSRRVCLLVSLHLGVTFLWDLALSGQETGHRQSAWPDLSLRPFLQLRSL